MDITNTSFHQSTLNNSLGTSPKVDGVIIYALIKYTNISAQPASTYQERKYKYHQMKDIILTHIFPALIPKVSKKSWADRYFKIINAFNNTDKLEANLDYYQFIIQEAMILIYTILYSNNYYMLEDFSDREYMEMVEQGGVTIG
jgi:hypothetical protein